MPVPSLLRWLRPTSIRVQLLGLLVLLALPTVVLAAYSSLERRATDEAAAREAAERLAQSYDDRVSADVGAAQQLLRPIAALFGGVDDLDEVEVEACQGFFAPFLEETTYESLAVVRADGSYLCADVDVPESAKLPAPAVDRLQRIGDRSVTLGITVSPLTGRFVLPILQPIHNRDGDLTGGLVISLEPRVLAPVTIVESLPMGSFATLVDSSGHIISRYPDPEGSLVGQSVADNPAFQTMLRQRTGTPRTCRASTTSSRIAPSRPLMRRWSSSGSAATP